MFLGALELTAIKEKHSQAKIQYRQTEKYNDIQTNNKQIGKIKTV